MSRVKTAKSAKGQKPAKAPKPKLAAANHFKNRIVGYELVDPKTIKRNPLNWRTHPDAQRSAMTDLVASLGYVDTLLVNKRTGHLIDGEMRLDIADENGERTVPVLWVDLSPEEERLALATLNPMSELATTDPEQLSKLLANRKPHDGPLDELLRSLEQMAQGAIVKPTKGTPGRNTTAAAGHTMRIVLAVPDVAEFERAILMTGIANRGEAVLEIARHYLSSHDDDTERQHDAGAQVLAEDQLAEALRGGAGHS